MKLLQRILPTALLLACSLAQQSFLEDVTEVHQSRQFDSSLSTELWLGGVLDQKAGESYTDEGMMQHNDEDEEQHRHLSRGRYNQCNVLRVFIRKSDIQRAALTSENGYSFQIPFYDRSTNRRRGIWYEQLTYANRQQNMGAGMVTLKFNVNTSLSMSVVAGQKQLAILGGSGTIGACPGGYGLVTGDTGDVVQFQFTICDACS
ncbi:hypothetical protein MPSEU_001058300 [Mayamaea pseudoterrestris]|nr:hypothetical protein MPSEU_001058300 [Mayamaea pseudoterrestris]